jgi:chromosome partitioning protein
VNQKGGVGKTTSVINLGAYIALAGKRVLLVDFDSQGNMTSGLGKSTLDKPTVYELMAESAAPSAVIRKTVIDNMDMIPGSIDLSGVDIELAGTQDKEFFLKKILDPLRPRYDYILIDCPPSLGVLTVNGLTVADRVLIPMQGEFFAVEGMTLLLKTIQRVQKTVNTSLKIGGIFFTMYDSRIRLAHGVLEDVKKHFKEAVFDTVIPRNVRLSETSGHGLPICKYDPTCIGATNYKRLADEILARNAEREGDRGK